MRQITIRSSTTDYVVVQLVGETADYRVYVIRKESSMEEFLMKIASNIASNGLLDREAYLLRELHEEMSLRDEEYVRLGMSEKSLGYQRCFPRLVETFLVSGQGNRRANIIAIYGAESMLDLVPIEQWRVRAKVRIDPRSSAWIMGRLLKIFTLTHPLGVSSGKVDGGNILVNPIEHHVLLFDWTRAHRHEGSLPKLIAAEEISNAARQVVLALGGNPATGQLPEHEQLRDSRYADMLKRMIDKNVSGSVSAGAEFYRLLDQLWEPGFHPFATHKLSLSL